MADAVKLVLDRLDALFRYILPGVMVLAAGYASHPSWFCWCDLRVKEDMIVLIALSIPAGALAYCVHRFSIHQLLDMVCSHIRSTRVLAKYREDLKTALETGIPRCRINEHIHTRSSQLIFLFICAEAFLVASIMCVEKDSFLDTHRVLVGGVSVIILVFAVPQYFLINELDRSLSR